MNNLDAILNQVAKPARYTGNEWNSIVKDWEQTPFRAALCYPETYELGASNLALPILYNLLNSQPGVLAEGLYTLVRYGGEAPGKQYPSLQPGIQTATA